MEVKDEECMINNVSLAKSLAGFKEGLDIYMSIQSISFHIKDDEELQRRDALVFRVTDPRLACLGLGWICRLGGEGGEAAFLQVRDSNSWIGSLYGYS